ncbi:MAG: hypothetical protein ACSLE0_23290 [Chitinophagaceae bacterium]
MSTDENKKKRQITFKNILSYLEGNTKYLMSTFGLYPTHKQEQVLWRLNICKVDCVKNGECEYCGCPPEKKAFVDKSCNDGDRFPDMMDEETWEKYKLTNNIDIDGTSI